VRGQRELANDVAKVNETIIYPAAGLLVMAIEAACQLSSPQADPTGYTLREVKIRKALIVPQSDDGVEVQAHLRPLREITDAFISWNEFQIYVYEDGTWSEICEGQVAVEYQRSGDNFDEGPDFQKYLEEHRTGVARCVIDFADGTFYRHVQRHGFAFGPCFQTLKNIRFNASGEATSTTNLQEWKLHTSGPQAKSHVIHPVALDAMFQSVIPALTTGLRRTLTTMVPTVIRLLTIFVGTRGVCSHLDQSDSYMEVYAKSNTRGFRNAESSFIALNKGDSNLPLIFGSFQLTASASQDKASKEMDERSLCSYIDWKPDLDLMSNDQVCSYCNIETSQSISKSVAEHQEIRKLAALVCHAALEKVKNWNLPQKLVEEKPYLQKYMAWVQYQLALFGGSDQIHDASALKNLLADETALKKLQSRVATANKEGELVVRVSTNLEKILNGDMNTLELLFYGNLMQEYYQEMHRLSPGFQGAIRYVDAFAHKQPDIRILEIGAGTGGATQSILHSLATEGNKFPRFSEYVFTDISASFFEDARERFSAFQDRMVFKTLNIGLDPLQQDFEENKFDLIVASSVSAVSSSHILV
jgi:hypothetical protein